MSFKFTLTSISSIAGLVGVADMAQADQFQDAVQCAYQKYTYLPKEDIKELSFAVNDWVIHYEKAVTLGTSFEYEDNVKTRIFNNILEKQPQCSKEINLATCAKELICKDQVFANFWSYWKDQHCQTNTK